VDFGWGECAYCELDTLLSECDKGLEDSFGKTGCGNSMGFVMGNCLLV
jgi:hypothetical protein